MRSAISQILWRSGLAGLARRLLVRGGRFAVLFHGISARRHPDVPADVQPRLSRSELDATLTWIRDHGFSFLTPEAFLQSDTPGVLLTFDDGLTNNATNALPVLEAHDAPAIFFVTTQHVRDPGNWLPATRAMALRHWPSEADVPEALAQDYFDGMTPEQLAACGRHPLITIGGHTTSHLFLSQCTPEVVRQEVAASKQYLEDVCGQQITLFAYPTGDFDRRVAEIVRAEGYEAAFALDARGIGLPAFDIPRVGLYHPEPSYLALKLSGLHRRPLRGAIRSALGPSDRAS